MFLQQEESNIGAKCIIFSTLSGEISTCFQNVIHIYNGLGNTGFPIFISKIQFIHCSYLRVYLQGSVEGLCYNFKKKKWWFSYLSFLLHLLACILFWIRSFPFSPAPHPFIFYKEHSGLTTPFSSMWYKFISIITQFDIQMSQVWPVGTPSSWLLWPSEHFLAFGYENVFQAHLFFLSQI